jgi:transposase-like protein
MSQRIAPSERVAQEMAGFLQNGIQSSEQPLSEFIRLAVQNMVQQVIEQEVSDYLGRERYERQAEPSGYRNGYKPGRIRSAEGEIAIEMPQVRGSEVPYQSRLMQFLRGNSDVLEYLVTQIMYSRGLSTCDVEDAFRATNLIERAFAEQHRRTKTIPRFWDEKSCLKLSFATLIQASERWQNVRTGELELAMLKQLRLELGLEITPAPVSYAKLS